MADKEIIEEIIEEISKGNTSYTLETLSTLILRAMELAEAYEGDGRWKKKIVVNSIHSIVARADMGEETRKLLHKALPGIVDVIILASKGSTTLNSRCHVCC